MTPLSFSADRQVKDLVVARRWLDRCTADSGLGNDSAPASVAGDALTVGIALTRQFRQSEARAWLRAAADFAPAHLLADIGGMLVDAADVTGAEAILRRSAEAGDPDGALHYGRLLLFDGRDEEAEPWLRQALEANPLAAQAVVSDLRHRGAHTEADRVATWAAEAGDGWAAADLALSAAGRGDRAEAERWVDWAEQMDHPGVARYRAALAELGGDDEAALRWLSTAAVDADVVAAAGLGIRLLERDDEAAALPHLEAAAEGGHVTSMFLLAALAGQRGMPSECARWAATGAAHDSDEAHGFAEELLAGGHHEPAETVLRACVAYGRQASRTKLGELLLRRDAFDEAVEVLRPAAELDPKDACLLLGMGEQGRGNLDAARLAYHRAAAAGDGLAAHNLGVISHEEGDLEAARRWYVEGARGGAERSMYNLAMMAADTPEGERWMVLAAAHGHPHAALRVGWSEVERGRREEGVRWIQQAVERGEPQAAQVLEMVLHRAPDLRPIVEGSAKRGPS